jgi:hypothetical protein
LRDALARCAGFRDRSALHYFPGEERFHFRPAARPVRTQDAAAPDQVALDLPRFVDQAARGFGAARVAAA